MPSLKSKFVWLAGFSTLASLFACYGTLAVLAILSAFGIAVALNVTLWAAAIVAFAALAICGLAIGFSHHRRILPLLIGGLGGAAVGYAMYANYSRPIELSGFFLLGVSAVWDWRLRRLHQSTPRVAE